MILPKISHPLYDIEIPSTKRKIKIRPMLGKEEKLLLMAKESGLDEDILGSIKQVVNNCIIDKLDVDKLTIFDLEFLFIRLRAYSVANIITVSYKDNEDEEVYDFQIDLNTIEIKFPEHTEKIIQVTDNISIRMKYPPASLYSDNEFLSASDKAAQDILIRRCIDAIIQDDTVIGLEGVSKQEVDVFLEDLPIKTYEKIREFLSNLPSINYVITYTNKKDHERKIELSTLNDFFTLR